MLKVIQVKFSLLLVLLFVPSICHGAENVKPTGKELITKLFTAYKKLTSYQDTGVYTYRTQVFPDFPRTYEPIGIFVDW